MNNNAITDVGIEPAMSQSDKKPIGKFVIVAICFIIVTVSIFFAIFEHLKLNKKIQQISELKIELENKNSEIADLETKITSSETQIGENDATATIILNEVINESNTSTVYKIGECSADGPSVKCPINIDGGEALISFTNIDSILRLTIPK